MQIYAAKNKDILQLRKSSSGGMFVLLSDEVFQRQGAVVCSCYDYDCQTMKFSLITDKNVRDSAIGSKYIQSDVGTVFQGSRKWLLEHPEKSIMFVGTGCQAIAFQNYMRQVGLKDRIITVDLICSGVPSPVVWKKYSKLLENKCKGKISYLTFKDKKNGWSQPQKYVIINSKKIDIREYCKAYSRHYIFRPSCHSCPYTITNRQTDITIGDFWGVKERLPEFYSEDGVSLLFIHTEKGREVFNKIEGLMDCCEIDSEMCKQPRLITPSEGNRKREAWWKDFHEKGAKYTLNHYSSDGVIKDIKRKIKEIFRGGQKLK